MTKSKHVMIGISGYSGSGKDEISNCIEKEFGAVKIGFADEAKRHMASLYDFSEEQLFGPSHFRNSGDPRYPKPLFKELECERVDEHFEFHESKIQKLPAPKMVEMCFAIKNYEISKDCQVKFSNTDPLFFLSPREALQRYCELMNLMYENTWVGKGIEDHLKLANYDFLMYDRMAGMNRHSGKKPTIINGHIITCSSDIRHWNEIHVLKNMSSVNTKIFLIRVKRPSIPNPPYDHRSETEQATIPDSEFDAVINNDSDLESLYKKVYRTVDTVINA